MVAAELGHIWRAIRSPGLWLTLLLAAVVIGLVYQVKREYVIDVGGSLDDAFVGGFNAKLPKDAEISQPTLTYRWTQGYAEIVLPAIGNQPYNVTLRANGDQPSDYPPQIAVKVNGPAFDWQMAREFSERTFPATRAGATYGDLRVAIIVTQTIRGDEEFCQPGVRSCALGVAVDWLKVSPTDYSLTALVIPDARTSGLLLLACAILYMMLFRVLAGRFTDRSATAASLIAPQQEGRFTDRSATAASLIAPQQEGRSTDRSATADASFVTPRHAGWQLPLMASLVAPLLLAAGLLLARLELTMFAGQLVVVLLWSWLLLVMVAGVVRWGEGRPASRHYSYAAGWLAGIVAFGFALRFGGMVHPQFVSSDLIFHAHKVDFMLRYFSGAEPNFYFEGYLPDGTPVPYPSAYYLLLMPFSALLGGDTLANALLLRFTSTLLDALVPLLLYYIARRIGFGVLAGMLAAGFYAVSPAVFQLYSSGNHSNIFAQAMFVGALAAIATVVTRAKGRGGATIHPTPLSRGWELFTTASLAATILLVLTFLGHYGMLIAAGLVLGVFVVGWLLLMRGRRATIWPMVAAIVSAGLVSYLLYYVHYHAQIGGQVQRVLAGSSGGSSNSTIFSIAAEIIKWQGWVILPLGLLGLLLLVARAYPHPTLPREGGGEEKAALVLIGSVLLAGLAFALLELRVRDSVRYNYLLAPALCLLAGLAVTWLRERAGHRAWLIYATALGLAAVYCLYIWGDLIFGSYRYPGRLY